MVVSSYAFSKHISIIEHVVRYVGCLNINIYGWIPCLNSGKFIPTFKNIDNIPHINMTHVNNLNTRSDFPILRTNLFSEFNL